MPPGPRHNLETKQRGDNMRDTSRANSELLYPFWVQAYTPHGAEEERPCLGWLDGLITDGHPESLQPHMASEWGEMTQEEFDSTCVRFRDERIEEGELDVIGVNAQMLPGRGEITCGRGVIADYATVPVTIV